MVGKLGIAPESIFTMEAKYETSFLEDSDWKNPENRIRGQSLLALAMAPKNIGQDVPASPSEQKRLGERRASKLAAAGRKASTLGRGVTKDDSNKRKSILWQAFNELDWKDESERKRVFTSYETLKQTYSIRRFTTGLAPTADMIDAAVHVTPTRRQSLFDAIEEKLTDAKEQHQESVRQANADSKKFAGYMLAEVPILTPKTRLTLDFITKMMDEFKKGRILQEASFRELLRRVMDIMDALPNITDLTIQEQCTLTVTGDIHGQLADLLTIFELNGLPSDANQYLFNGDFVDRGSYSCEVIILLYGLKVLYPQAVHLNRGNHEARDMNAQHGFETEVLEKYNTDVFYELSKSFGLLPLAALVNKKIFVVHGGMSWEDGIKLSDIAAIDRKKEVPPEDTLFEDLLWSDPCEEKGRMDSDRGCGLCFGPDVCHAFMELNGLDLIIRSHECVDEGYEWWFDNKLVTIFSASSYCGTVDNKAAIILLTPDLEPTFVQYEASPFDELPKQHLSKKFSRRWGC